MSHLPHITLVLLAMFVDSALLPLLLPVEVQPHHLLLLGLFWLLAARLLCKLQLIYLQRECHRLLLPRAAKVGFRDLLKFLNVAAGSIVL